jgi:hypothetical protein
MIRSIPRAVILALACAATTSHAGPKCEAGNKLFQGQVTTSEPLSEGDVSAVVDCKSRGGYAMLPGNSGWFQVDMVEEACLSTVWVLPKNNADGFTNHSIEFLAADGTVLDAIGDLFTSQNGVWHRTKFGYSVCGVKSVRFVTRPWELSPFGYLELKAH